MQSGPDAIAPLCFSKENEFKVERTKYACFGCLDNVGKAGDPEDSWSQCGKSGNLVAYYIKGLQSCIATCRVPLSIAVLAEETQVTSQHFALATVGV